MVRARIGVPVAYGSVAFLFTYISIRFANCLGIRAEGLGIPLFFRCAVGVVVGAVAAVAHASLGDARRRRSSAWLPSAVAASIILVTAQSLLDP